MKKCSLVAAAIALICFALNGCGTSNTNIKNNSNSEILESGSYIGNSGTSEIIEVESSDTWKIKNRHKDDSTYSIVSVTDTKEKIGDFNIIKVVATEINGHNTPFADRKGQKFIIAKDEAGVYFELVGDKNKESITENLEKAEDKVEYIKEVANYEFTKQ